MSTNFVYTDASFNKSFEIAVIGYGRFSNQKDHDSLSASQTELKYKTISELNNIRAEVRSAIFGIQSCPLGEKVVLFTDCKTVSDLPTRRGKLERNHFMSQKTGSLLANGSLYREFFQLIDQYELEIRRVKGHMPSKDRGLVQTHFSFLDREVRMNLRREVVLLESGEKG